jgi:hypothetical protein
MKNLKIGITIKLESVEDSMWTNGMKLNILMLINLLNNSENNYEVHLLNVKDISLENMPKHLQEANFGLLGDKYKDMDLLISMGAQVNQHIIDHYREDPNKKIIVYKCGNNYILSMEAILFKDSPEHYPIFDEGIDEIWYVPQQHETNRGFYRTMYRCNVLPVPFIWDSKYIDYSLNSVDASFEAGAYKKDSKYDPTKEKKTIGVMEPNINVVKFGLIPSMIAEECYRGYIGKEKIDRLMITNSTNIVKHKEFMGMIKTFDLYKDGKINGEARYQTAYIVSQFMDVVISHQVLNPLNYLYLDVAYMGYPVLHNAPLCKDVGYYYEGGDTKEAAKMLEHILLTHDNNLEEYKERTRKSLERYLVSNKNLILSYDALIHNLFNGGNKEDLVYCEKTNTVY